MSFRDRALADLTVDDMRAMLRENETLFVEHKRSLRVVGSKEARREHAFQVVKAASSFANGLSGWLLIGVHDSQVVSEDLWSRPTEDVFVDQVREVLNRGIDPPVPFAAGLREVDGKTVGVIRVYESVDTPHIVLANGGIYVREVAKDRRLANGRDAYDPTAVRSQVLLAQLVNRGGTARARVERLLSAGVCPWIEAEMGLRYERISAHAVRVSRPGAGSVLRLVPMTTPPQFTDWAVSRRGFDAAKAAAASLCLREPGDANPALHVSGVGARERSLDGVSTLPGIEARSWTSHVALDGAGVVGLSVNFGNPQPAPDPLRLTVNGLRWMLIEPLLREGARLLESGGFVGRVSAHLLLTDLSSLIHLDQSGLLKPGPNELPLGGDIVLPTESTLDLGSHLDGHLGQLSAQWADDAARSVGFPILR